MSLFVTDVEQFSGEGGLPAPTPGPLPTPGSRSTIYLYAFLEYWLRLASFLQVIHTSPVVSFLTYFRDFSSI